MMVNKIIVREDVQKKIMNCSEIVYERKMTGSFMKLKCDGVKELDEKILLKNDIPGFLSMEKCFVNGKGQYWYDISGAQSLEMRCQYNDIKLDFLERLVVNICDRMELLENHLISTECLILEPQLIYISNHDEEIFFTAYPAEMKTMYTTFQHLMEFMLTRLDHSDAEAIHIAYGIYEKTLNGNYSITDIRNAIIDERRKKAAQHQCEEIAVPILVHEEEDLQIEKKESLYDKIKKYVLEHFDICLPEIKNKASDKISKRETKTIKSTLNASEKDITKKDKKEIRNIEEKENIISMLKKKRKIETDNKEAETFEDDLLVQPLVPEEPVVQQIHPTVCLSDYREHPQGMLLYEGVEKRNNIIIEKNKTCIGQTSEADAVIKKDTISHLHAVINKENLEFYLEDLNSTNGTFVNDELLSYKEKKQLKINDIVRFADVKYRFV